ncbi:MAG: dihydroflavonol 4-reductase [Nitrospiraceae bacterium]|nr:dihydroflavonol 4-reductase [Nitrospiraceae bacterium]
MKALVLGATGHLGNNLVRALLAKGVMVRVLVRPRSKLQTLIGLDIQSVVGDLNDVESLMRACEGIHVVYHCAGYYPVQTIPVCVATTQALKEIRNVINATTRASIDRLVYASTSTTIGFPKDPNVVANEEYQFASGYPDNPYLMSKAAMEREVMEAAKVGFPAVVVNPTVLLGPFDSKPTSGTQIVMIAKGVMPGYIDGLVNVIDVRDVASGMICAAERGRVGERYILGNWNTTQKALNDLIAKVADVNGPLVPVPFQLVRYGSKVGEWAFRNIFGIASPVPGFFVEMVRHIQHYDCSKAISELAYPRSPIEPAIRAALTWFRENRYV